MIKKIVLGVFSTLFLASTAYAGETCCGYGYIDQEQIKKHPVKFYKNDLFWDFKIQDLNHKSVQGLQLQLAEVGIGDEERTGSSGYYWGVVFGQSIGSDKVYQPKIDYRAGLKTAYLYRNNKFNIGMEFQAVYDQFNYSNKSENGASIVLQLQTGYNFTDDFYFGFTYQEEAKFNGYGIVFRTNW